MTVRAGTAYWKIWRLVNNFFCSHNKVHCSEIPIVLINLLYHFFHWIMANFNFVISQNAKWGLPVFTLIATGWQYQKIFFYKKSTEWVYLPSVKSCTRWLYREFIWHKGLPGLHNNSQTAAGCCRLWPTLTAGLTSWGWYLLQCIIYCLRQLWNRMPDWLRLKVLCIIIRKCTNTPMLVPWAGHFQC